MPRKSSERTSPKKATFLSSSTAKIRRMLWQHANRPFGLKYGDLTKFARAIGTSKQAIVDTQDRMIREGILDVASRLKQPRNAPRRFTRLGSSEAKIRQALWRKEQTGGIQFGDLKKIAHAIGMKSPTSVQFIARKMVAEGMIPEYSKRPKTRPEMHASRLDTPSAKIRRILLQKKGNLRRGDLSQIARDLRVPATSVAWMKLYMEQEGLLPPTNLHKGSRLPYTRLGTKTAQIRQALYNAFKTNKPKSISEIAREAKTNSGHVWMVKQKMIEEGILPAKSEQPKQ